MPTTALIEKLPPHNDEAELAVIGAMMLEKESLQHGARFLRQEDFYHEPNGLAFAALCEIEASGKPYDPLVLEERLQAHGWTERVGWPGYMGRGLEACGYAGNIAHYSRLVKEAALRREVIRLARESERQAVDSFSKPLPELLAALKETWACLGDGQLKETLRPLSAVMHDAFEDLQARQDAEPLRSGLSNFDNYLGGFFPGTLTFLAGRPREGKTTLALNILANMAIKDNTPCAFFSMEMKDIALAHKILAREAGIDAWKLRIARPGDDGWTRVAETCGRLNEVPLLIDDRAGLRINELAAGIRFACNRKKVRCVVVDYLQLLTHNPERIRAEMVIATHTFKALARQLDIALIVLSQVSRQAEARIEHRPTLADLKESGSIEEDGDIILFLWHETPPRGPRSGEVETENYRDWRDNGRRVKVIVGKNRLGPADKDLDLRWIPSRQAFYAETAGAEEKKPYYLRERGGE